MNYSVSDRADIQWLKSLLYYTAIACSATVAAFALHNITGMKTSPIVSATLFFFVNIGGLAAIKKQTTFVVQHYLPETEAANDKISKSYLNYGLKQADAQLLAERLRIHMDSQKPYINPDLCLRDLAGQLEVYPHYITQVLSTLFNQNFYDFVNTYRVGEAKKLLTGNTDNLTILTIAYNCGFNSKSSFNRIFKQKTGLTPSGYKERTEFE